MAQLTSDQRNYYYLIEAERAGIHKPILAALYEVQDRPQLSDGESGLGISLANRVAAVNSFPEQVQYAANTLRSLTDTLIAEGWSSTDLWDAAKGQYSDRFIQRIAAGYAPPSSDQSAARLETSNAKKLLDAYISDMTYDYGADQLPQNLAGLDDELLAAIEAIARTYTRLDFQRLALLEAVRIWRKLDSQGAAVKSLDVPITDGVVDEPKLDSALLKFIRQVSRFYGGYPFQREALIRLVQLWQQLDSRTETLRWLAKSDPYGAETHIKIIDPALLAFVQRIPSYYKGEGIQRFALTEGYRLWNQLDSRTSAIKALGVSPQFLKTNAKNPTALAKAAVQVDQSLLNFIEGIPKNYDETEPQREALIRLVQIWRRLDDRIGAVQSLFEDVRRMTRASRTSLEAPIPKPSPLPPRPDRWTPNNIQLDATIIANGNFTWAEATHGGTRMPLNQATVEAIIRIAKLAQQARDRIGRPFVVTSWYRPPEINRRVGGASQSRHIVGDAMDFYVSGLTGNQVYQSLSPWWPGGLGRYAKFPRLAHIDSRSYRARWRH